MGKILFGLAVIAFACLCWYFVYNHAMDKKDQIVKEFKRSTISSELKEDLLKHQDEIIGTYRIVCLVAAMVGAFSLFSGIGDFNKDHVSITSMSRQK